MPYIFILGVLPVDISLNMIYSECSSYTSSHVNLPARQDYSKQFLFPIKHAWLSLLNSLGFSHDCLKLSRGLLFFFDVLEKNFFAIQNVDKGESKSSTMIEKW